MTMANAKPQKRYKGKKVAFLTTEGAARDAYTLGGKGAGLVELTSLGVPVPPACTVGTGVARAYAQHGQLPKRLAYQLDWGIASIEKETGKRFGDEENPLTVSVRSGASVSMPGMMDTVLNLGLNGNIVRKQALRFGKDFAYDCYRRFLSMFGEVVLGIDRHAFESEYKKVVGDGKPGEHAEELCRRYLKVVQEAGRVIPDDARQQLEMAVYAVLNSWNNPRAVQYRRHHKLDDNMGTAVNIQAMVFGNRDEQSLTGVAFSSNVATGEEGLWGEFLVKAQGEDLVDGSHNGLNLDGLKQVAPAIHCQLKEIAEKLAMQRGAPVELEFTVETGRLYVLQVRNAKLSPLAAVTTAVRKVFAKEWTKEEALNRVTSHELETVQAKGFDQEDFQAARAQRLAAFGLPASPGVAVGEVVLSAQAAVKAAAQGRAVILVRPDTSPDDLSGMIAARAVVTASGGSTSHAAVVTRGLGKPAVVGCGTLNLREGETISVDGGSGVVVRGAIKLTTENHTKEVNLFLRWHSAHQESKLKTGKLDFSLTLERQSYNGLLNDFYLVDALALACRSSNLNQQAQNLKVRLHGAVAARLAMYLVVAVGGEIRHAQMSWLRTAPLVDELVRRFDIQLGGQRGAAQRRNLVKLQKMGHQDHVRFLQLCKEVFQKGDWSSSYGGPSWAAIAEAAEKYLTGAYPASVFADHAFDLEHNNGSVFGKNEMLYGDRHDIKMQLDKKKHAQGICQLYSQLSRYGSYSQPVEALYQSGLALGLYRP
ncbi:MAG: pyruvate, phosphate dikinase [Candidatus Obscuribacterales bacterium]|nr:pyruvate, phosphate dikinase [Candidatus Obscuribacterales bacterium]